MIMELSSTKMIIQHPAVDEIIGILASTAANQVLLSSRFIDIFLQTWLDLLNKTMETSNNLIRSIIYELYVGCCNITQDC